MKHPASTHRRRAAAPGRLRPEPAVLRQALDSPQGLSRSGLSPKQGPTLPEGRSLKSAIGVSS